ncbi:MAG: YggS family pyridoxal phosphate-dependent enzyme [Burkholderiales bacterium]|nr:YggS family pyridoxal phosphate-dependent enzyme [Burkholderiales bacterium]ODU66630.1 MAG: YggS family pyridoxal phosphate enzyme [Lautropia sp. SCN 66-9]
MNGDPALRQRYEQVLERIRAACQRAGRPVESVHLLAVSKTFPAESVLALAALGQRAFGENYLQEAVDKIAACRDERSAGGAGLASALASASAPAASVAPVASAASAAALQWHFIGPIQSNKTRPIAEHFDWVHSVDRERIARRLSEQRPADMAPLAVCLQVNISGESSKSGASPAEALELAPLVATLPRLALRGLMAIPAASEDFDEQRRQCAALRELFERIRARGGVGECFDTLSMGMSADLEAAICEGATLVRVGTALFGSR